MAVSGIGPRSQVAQIIHAEKYRQRGESFDDYCVRYARTTADDEKHFRGLLDGLRSQAILPGGRQQRAVGWPFQTTAFSCFVAGSIGDSIDGIMDALKEAALTLRSGGGYGADFSTIRGEREPVRGLGEGAYASGPVSFMRMWDSMCGTMMSAGERRGAMMGVLRVDHPDIMKFIRAKQNSTSLTNFNISVGVTSDFIEAVRADKNFKLRFGGSVISQVRALDLWAILMENNWDWAEPGVLFLDTINRMNPLAYLELIAATNPCSEQPLPPYGACLLLSHNLVKYLVPTYSRNGEGSTNGQHSGRRAYEIDLDRLRHDVALSVRACDNVFERTVYPLEQYRKEALDKRRMGIGLTGVANALEVCGYRYATPQYLDAQDRVLEVLRDTAYTTSIDMARTKGSFPLFDADKWLASGFGRTLPDEIQAGIRKYGLRNGLLLSIAPTGTISLAADNVSSGIEPPPIIEQERDILFSGGKRRVSLNDHAWEEHGVRCQTAIETTPLAHVEVVCRAQRWIDSSISKTVNVRGARQEPGGEGEVSFSDFKDLYLHAHDGGAKGCSTFNMNGKRAGIIVERAENGEHDEHLALADSACYIDPVSGTRSCE